MDEGLRVLFQTFEAHGRQLYIVGGAVRDLLLGQKPADYDLTTDALPQEMEAWFEKTLAVGKRFGTIGVVLEGKVYEITTFRRDKGYVDGRHPGEVVFSDDVREDVVRRDFTINGLLMDSQGIIYDYVGGFEDLASGMVRCIGAPDERFNEDKLRKWRCIRIAAEKAMEIESHTRESIHHNPATEGVSVERIRKELDRIIMADKVTWGGYLLVKTDLMTDLLNRIVPSYRTRRRDYHLVESFEIMAYLPKDYELRLSVLAVPMLPVERLEFFSFMHYPKDVIQKVLHFSRNFWVDTEDIVAFKKAMAEVGPADFERLLTFQEGQARWDYNPDRQTRVARNRECYEAIMAGGEPILRQDLAISGSDLCALGMKGPAIAKGLNTALDWVYQHPEDNEKDKLLALLRKENHE